jgi:hypothetical protein
MRAVRHFVAAEKIDWVGALCSQHRCAAIRWVGMESMKHLNAIYLLSALAACGGSAASPAPTASVSGEGDGGAFRLGSAFAFAVPATDPGGQTIAVVLSTQAGLTCTSPSIAPASSTLLRIAVVNEHGAVTPGTYSIGDAVGVYTALTSTCGESDVDAYSGTMTLTQVGATVSGSYSMTFWSGETFSGEFANLEACTSTPAALVCRP